jgi:hypothetical protein
MRRRFGFETLRDGAVGDLALDGFDADRIVVNIECA